MTDPEKVITHLDDMRLFADTRVHQIVSPENWGIYSDLCDLIDLVKGEILAMLKEQEPKTVLGIADSIEGIEVGKCPRCERTILNKHSDPTWYCKYCGQAVTWNG